MPDQEIVAHLRMGGRVFNEWRSAQEWYRLLNADLDGVSLRDVDLGQVNLTNLSFNDADFSGCFLAGADLSHSSCIRANFQGADLAGADFTNALAWQMDLRSANLGGRIQRPGLVMITRQGTRFHDTTLYNTDFGNSTMWDTHFMNVDLTYCIGLDEVIFAGESYIDLHTVARSKALPVAFLKGIGLPDQLIANIASVQGMPFEYRSCFLSYSSSDAAFCRHLYDALIKSSIRVWHDEHDLLPGHDLHDAISSGIRTADVVLLVCSQSSLNSWWVESEIDRAFRKEMVYQREMNTKKQFIIPLDIDGFIHDKNCTSSRAEELLTRKIADFREWTIPEKFESALQEIKRSLRIAAVAPEAPYRFKRGERWNPFKTSS